MVQLARLTADDLSIRFRSLEGSRRTSALAGRRYHRRDIYPRGCGNGVGCDAGPDGQYPVGHRSDRTLYRDRPGRSWSIWIGKACGTPAVDKPLGVGRPACTGSPLAFQKGLSSRLRKSFYPGRTTSDIHGLRIPERQLCPFRTCCRACNFHLDQPAVSRVPSCGPFTHGAFRCMAVGWCSRVRLRGDSCRARDRPFPG